MSHHACVGLGPMDESTCTFDQMLDLNDIKSPTHEDSIQLCTCEVGAVHVVVVQ